MVKEYQLKEGMNKIVVPEGSHVLGGGKGREGKVCVWLEVDLEEKEFTEMVFLVVKSGGEMEEGAVLEYIGYARIGDVPYLVFEVL